MSSSHVSRIKYAAACSPSPRSLLLTISSPSSCRHRNLPPRDELCVRAQRLLRSLAPGGRKTVALGAAAAMKTPELPRVAGETLEDICKSVVARFASQPAPSPRRLKTMDQRSRREKRQSQPQLQPRQLAKKPSKPLRRGKRAGSSMILDGPAIDHNDHKGMGSLCIECKGKRPLFRKSVVEALLNSSSPRGSGTRRFVRSPKLLLSPTSSRGSSTKIHAPAEILSQERTERFFQPITQGAIVIRNRAGLRLSL